LKERFDVGYVLWADAMMDRKQTHVPEHRAYTMLTAGILVKNDKKGVTVAQDMSEEGSLREVMFIPRQNVQYVKILERNVAERAPQMVALGPPAKTKARSKKTKRG
jgi:hypothetical protein